MTSVRLLADDLTGALDTAAEFVGLCGPFDVIWPEALCDERARRALRSTAAHASSRRPRASRSSDGWRRCLRDGHDRLQESRQPAARRVGGRARRLPAAAAIGRPASSRRPSTIRGAAPATVSNSRARCEGDWYRGRSTICWTQLRADDIDARQGRADTLSHGGVQVFDAESDRDLDRVVEMGRRMAAPVLWCGSGGLAGALARGSRADAPRHLKRPVLGLFGSDQIVTASQLAACGEATLTLAEGEGAARAFSASWPTTAWRWSNSRCPRRLSRAEAARRIAREMTTLIASARSARHADRRRRRDLEGRLRRARCACAAGRQGVSCRGCRARCCRAAAGPASM